MTVIQDYLKYTQNAINDYGEKSCVLMQVGSFFEIYGLQDKKGNIIGSKIVDIANNCDLIIANKNCKHKIGKEIYGIKMAGFGLGQIDKYVKNLQQLGYTCLIYVQDIQASNTTRSLSEIISPGTFFNTESKNVSNYVSCIWISKTNNRYLNKQGISKTDKYNEIIQIGLSSSDVLSGYTEIWQWSRNYQSDNAIYDDLEKQLSVINPHECIIISDFLNNQQLDDLCIYLGISDIKTHKITNTVDNEFSKKIKNAKRQIYQCEILKYCYDNIPEDVLIDSIKANPIAIQSLTVLLDFMKQHNPVSIKNIMFPKISDTSNILQLANHSLRQLNIIEDNRYTGKFSSIATFLDNCVTKLGNRRFRRKISLPSTDIEVLNKQYDTIQYCIDTGIWKQIKEGLSGISDIEVKCRLLARNKLYPRHISILYNDIVATQKLLKLFIRDKTLKTKQYSELKKKVDNLEKELKTVFNIDICKNITNLCFDKQKHDIDLLQIFQKNYCKQLDDKVDLCRENSVKFNKICKYLSGLVKNIENKKKQDTQYIKIYQTPKGEPILVGTSRRVSLLEQEIQKLVKKNSLTQPISSTKCVVSLDTFQFRIDDIVSRTNGNNKKDKIVSNKQIINISQSLDQTTNQVIDIIIMQYNLYCKKLTNKINIIQEIIEYIGDIDLLQNNCFVATKYNYCKPIIQQKSDKDDNMRDTTSSYIDIKGLRHLLIEHINTKELYVTNDIDLGLDTNGILLYGTNAVGKSSLIKALGVCIVLAQAGMYVPCTNMTYFPYQKIFTRILGNDDLFRGLSTFAVEMSELRTILSESDPNSLILGDELCAGTESKSAHCIFAAGLETLHNKNTNFIFATHFHEIKQYDEIKQLEKLTMMHMSVRYDNHSGTLIYDRKLKRGAGDSIYGLEVCKSMNLPTEFLDRAEQLRIKYSDDSNSYLDIKHSLYSRDKIKDICELCKKKADDIHHLQYQSDAGINKYIGSFHKNHPANLLSVCKRCHSTIHEKDIRYIKKKTNTGEYKLQEIPQEIPN